MLREHRTLNGAVQRRPLLYPVTNDRVQLAYFGIMGAMIRRPISLWTSNWIASHMRPNIAIARIGFAIIFINVGGRRRRAISSGGRANSGPNAPRDQTRPSRNLVRRHLRSCTMRRSGFLWRRHLIDTTLPALALECALSSACPSVRPADAPAGREPLCLSRWGRGDPACKRRRSHAPRCRKGEYVGPRHTRSARRRPRLRLACR